jgi:ATP-dependent Clp protease ATP-binding subunit ClpC
MVSAIHQTLSKPRCVFQKKYIKERFLPDKAIDLIDEAGAKVSIESTQHTQNSLGLLHAAGQDKTRQREILEQEDKRLEEELHHLKQLEDLFQEEGEVREIRKRMERLLQEREALKSAWENHRSKPEVSADDIRHIVSDWMDIPLANLT